MLLFSSKICAYAPSWSVGLLVNSQLDPSPQFSAHSSYVGYSSPPQYQKSGEPVNSIFLLTYSNLTPGLILHLSLLL